MTSVTVITPTIAPRVDLLARAIECVQDQTIDVKHIVIEDVDREGPSPLRQRATEQAETEWVCYYDDDDVLEPTHVEDLLAHAAAHPDADLIYPWFTIYRNGTKVGNEPLRVANHLPFKRPFDDLAKKWILTRANFIPVTVMVRRELIVEVGWAMPGTEEWPHENCGDWGTWQKLLRAGAVFSHLPKRTWQWWMWGGNTSGRVDRW